MINPQRLHYNIPQLISAIIDAPFEVDILARGTGKTEGIGARKTAKRMDTMPRGSGVIVGSTFQQLLTRTLPPAIKGWEKLGYKLGIHYLIGQKPPDRWQKLWKWPGPYQRPLKFDYIISWYNGACIQLVSQDRIGSSNGLSIDWIYGDEAKLLNHERLKDELFPANRGLIAAFANDPHHHGITFTSDMPVGTSGRWLLEYEDQMDKAKVREILQLQSKLQEIQQIENPDKKLRQFMREIDEATQLLRNDLVFYQEASALDNLSALGVKFIRQLMRDLDPFTFSTAVLNRKPRRLEDGFYPDLNEEKHGYFAYDYHEFENLGYEFDKLKELGVDVDADYSTDKAFHLVVDNNKALTPLVVGQRASKYEIRLINSFYSEFPKKMKDTVDAFCKYYEHHKRKVIYLWYDHTLIQETGHSKSVVEEITKQLRKEGWIVIDRYTGQAMSHEHRYRMYGHLLQEDGYYKHILRINRDRCANVLNSMFQTGAIRTKNGFGKDKSTEKDPKFPQLEAPHFGEAVDMLVGGILESDLSWEDESVGAGAGMDML